jgi:hypothetical protein
MAYQNTLEFRQHCLSGLVDNYLLSEVQSHVSEMQEVSPQSLMVTSGKMRLSKDVCLGDTVLSCCFTVVCSARLNTIILKFAL